MMSWPVSHDIKNPNVCGQFLPLAVVSFKPGIKQEQAGLRLLSFQTRGHEVGGKTLLADIKARWRLADSKHFQIILMLIQWPLGHRLHKLRLH